MTKINFSNKTFSLIENSENGSVNSDAIFRFKQEGNMVTADYSGVGIRYGKIIALLENNRLHMRYQCITDSDELKAGKAIAKISVTRKNKIRLNLNWEWLGEAQQKGTSEYLEN